MADIVSPDFRPQVGTVRAGTFRYPTYDESRIGEIIDVPVQLGLEDFGTLLKEILPEISDDNPVEEASVIVSGGRGGRNRAIKSDKPVKVFLPRYILLLGFPVLCSICAQ